LLDEDGNPIAVNEDTPKGEDQDGNPIVVDEDGKVVRVEEQDVGPAEDEADSEPKKSHKKEGSEPKEKYEAPLIELDEENDPKWYRSHMSTYPCYKLTD